jgi:hypothetical protein
VEIWSGALDLKVSDVDAFLTDPKVRTALQEGFALTLAWLGSSTETVEIGSVQAARRLSGAERRLAAGSVTASYKLTFHVAMPGAFPSLGKDVQTNTNAALAKAGKTVTVTQPAVLKMPTKLLPTTTPTTTTVSVTKPKLPTTTLVPTTTVSVTKPKLPTTTLVPTTTPCPTTTPHGKQATTPHGKQATTTTPQFYTEITADMILEVDDTDEFLTNVDVVSSLNAAIASLLEIPSKEVDITSMTLITATEERRLGTQGKVKAGAKVKDPANKLTPAKVKGIAPKLPAAANKNLAKKGVKGKVGKATIPQAAAAKKPNQKPDPCKTQVVVPPVVVPPVAPVNPCAPVVAAPPPVAPASPCAPVVVAPAPVAPVNPCAPVVKYSEQEKVAANGPAFNFALLLVIPGFLSMAFVANKIRHRQNRAVAYTSMDQESDAEVGGME